ncbi:MAG TPA: hypothetical protein PKV69_03365 [Candidatus Hydrogenedentes bacterium]|nr:hypothetical protein [Candidatus Hydrogenedentota bacterium]
MTFRPETDPREADAPPGRWTPRQARRLRALLLLLLLAAGGLAVGSAVVRRRLDVLRDDLMAEVSRRAGGRFSVGRVSLSGLRGVSVEEVRMIWERGGLRATVDLPRVDVYFDWSALAAGTLSPGHVHLTEASVEVALPPAGEPSAEEPSAAAPPAGLTAPPALPALPPLAFRVSGERCRVRVSDVPQAGEIALEEVGFDVSRQPGAADLLARLSGRLAGVSEAPLVAVVRYAGPDDFSLRAETGVLAVEKIGALLPERARVLTGGTVTPVLTLEGQRGGRLSLALDAEMEALDAKVRPEFIAPLTGTLAVRADADLPNREILVRNARLETPQASGRITGSVLFGADGPVLDLKLDADTLPVNEAVTALLPETVGPGDLSVELGAPHRLAVHVSGPASSPSVLAEAGAASGKIVFKPTDKKLPGASLELGQIQDSYDLATKMPGGMVAILNGGLLSPYQGLMLDQLSGSVLLVDGKVKLVPLSARLNGHAFLGRAEYEIAKQTLSFSADGAVSDLEKSALHHPSKELWIYGSAALRCHGTASPKKIVVEASADATEAQIEIEWWFRKPRGTGATIKAFKAEIIPRKSMKITGEASIDGTQLKADLLYLWRDGKFSSEHVRLDFPFLEVATAGKCIRIPYRAYGTHAKDGYYEVVRAGTRPDGNIATIGGVFDDVSFLPNGCPYPLHCRNAKVEVTLDNVHETIRTGVISVHAESAEVPALKENWLLPLEPEDPEYYVKFPGLPRSMKYELSADAMQMPPWTGSQFKGTVYNEGEKTGLSHFEAVVDGGRLEGAYDRDKKTNYYTLKATWDGIPARYVIRHLELPEILDGPMSGWVDYSMDADDPATLQGKGTFHVRNGNFVPDPRRHLRGAVCGVRPAPARGLRLHHHQVGHRPQGRPHPHRQHAR